MTAAFRIFCGMLTVLLFAKALKGVDKEVKKKIFRNMSKEAAKMLEEDIGFIGTIPEKERDEAQIYIVGIFRRLEERNGVRHKKKKKCFI